VALSAVNKFILYGFLSPDSVQTPEVLCLTAEAVSQCRFQSIDKTVDEQVYLQVCTVLLHCIICSGGALLTDGAVWLCIKTCYDISKTEVLSDIVCRHAEDVLMQMVLSVFKNVAQKHVKSAQTLEGVATDATATAEPSKAVELSPAPPANGIGDTAGFCPYSSQCLLWITKWLLEMVNPQTNTDQRRAYGLTLINVALETSARMIGTVPAIASAIGHDLCKYLLQNTQTEDVTILSLTLRVIFNLFNSTLKAHLKVQLEVFFNTIHLRIPAQETEAYEKKELVLESVVEFCSEPDLMVDLYTNYDEDVEGSDLFKQLGLFLSKGTASGGVYSMLDQLSLDGGVALVDSIWQRFCNPATAAEHGRGRPVSDATDEDEEKKEKQRMAMAAKAFNEHPRKSLPHLVGLGVIDDENDAAQVAKFCRTCNGIDKKVLGEFMGKVSTPFNQEVLKEFVKTFDFTGTTLDDALRDFLVTFRLPGEAQQIDAFMCSFANRWYMGNPEKMKHEDTAYVVAFSIIMLNTDLHNDNIKPDRKMTEQQYISMNRGIDVGGANVPEELLRGIYHNIKNNEIKMNPEVKTAAAELEEMDDDRWAALLRSSSSQISSVRASAVVGQEMFNTIWEPLVQSMCAGLDSSLKAVVGVQQERIVFKIMQGVRRICDIADFYKMPEVVNRCLSLMCKSLEAQISALSDALGSNGAATVFRGSGKLVLQLVDAVFSLAYGHLTVLKTSWRALLKCVLKLNSGNLKLLPSGLVELDDFVDSSGRALPSTVALLQQNAQKKAADRTDSDKSVGFFASIWGVEGGENEKTAKQEQEDVEATAHAKLLASQCHIEELFTKSRDLPLETVKYMIDSLMRCSGGQGCVSDESEPASPRPVSQHEMLNDELLGRVHALEWLTNVCSNNENRFDQVWPLVAQHFEDGISSVGSTSPGGSSQPSLLVERHVVSVLRICTMFNECEDVDTVLATLRPLCSKSLSSSQAEILGERVTAGLLMMLKLNGPNIRQPETWRLVFELCRMYAHHPSLIASVNALEAVQHLVIELGRFLPLEVLPLAVEVAIEFRDDGNRSPQAVDDDADASAQQSGSLTVLNLLLTLLSSLKHPAETDPGRSASGSAPPVTVATLTQQILSAISSMCLDTRLSERAAAFEALQKVVLEDDTLALDTAEDLVWLLEKLLYGMLRRITALTASEDDLRGTSRPLPLLSSAFGTCKASNAGQCSVARSACVQRGFTIALAVSTACEAGAG
jgi:brefeldin A-resistance guanine nucleotide exchange factor 1